MRPNDVFLTPRLTGGRFEHHYIPLDIKAQVEELKALKNGWLDGRGLAPDQDGIEWVAAAFSRNLPDCISYPYLYPTAEGGLLAEWSIDQRAISLEVDLKHHTGAWHELEMDSDHVVERNLNLENEEDWQWIAEQFYAGKERD